MDQFNALSGVQRAVLDELPLGIARTNRDGNITYANRAASRLAGTRNLEGAHMTEIFPDSENLSVVRNFFHKRITERLVNEYNVHLTRLNDGAKIPISITALPEVDDGGDVTGALAIVRSLVPDLVRQHIQGHGVVREGIDGFETVRIMLTSVAHDLALEVPFDLFNVTRYSRDGNHVRPFFTYAPGKDPSWQVRWWEMPPVVRDFVDHLAREKAIVAIDDLNEWYDHPDRRALKDDPDVKGFLDQGFRSCLAQLVTQQGSPVGSIAVYKKDTHAFSKEHIRVFESLPLADAVLTAIHEERLSTLGFCLALAKEISSASNNVGSVADVIVNKIASQYQWDNVSIFRVNEDRDEIELLSQNQSAPIRYPRGFTQGIEEGVLGYVYTHNRGVRIPDVTTSADFKDRFLAALPGVKSELCLPVGTDKVQWLLNVEDSKRNAFAEEEKEEIEGIMREVSALLHKLSLYELLKATQDSSTDAIIVTDGKGRITSVNPATVKLLGYDANEMTGTHFTSYVKDQRLANAILKAVQIPPDATVLLRKGGQEATALLSGGPLPHEIGGRVYAASDLSLRKSKERLEMMRDVYYEIAVQTKTPLSISFSALKTLENEAQAEEREAIQDVLRQLRMVEMTMNRLATIEERVTSLQHCETLLAIPRLVDNALQSIPKSERVKVDVFCDDKLPNIKGDLHQLSFCLRSTLAFLLRFATRNCMVRLVAARSKGNVSISLAGRVPEVDLDTVQSYADAEWIAEALQDIAVGHKLLERMAKMNRGEYSVKTGDDGKKEFRFRFPACDDGDRFDV